MLLGIVAYWALVDFPDKAVNSWKFLNQREAMFIIDRVNRDRGDAKPEPFSARKFFGAATDIKIWGFSLVSTVFSWCTTTAYRTRSSSIRLP
jgi:hypothetical protein